MKRIAKFTGFPKTITSYAADFVEYQVLTQSKQF